MKPLYTQEQFNQAKSRELLPLECKCCCKTFLIRKSYIQVVLSGSREHKHQYCSSTCRGEDQRKKRHQFKCTQCGKDVIRGDSELTSCKRKGLINHFCSSRCAGLYNSLHKTHGTRRSKLEIWLEGELFKLYPSLSIHFNRKDAINSELDIYIPSLKLAFELNGIFHYEPIYGADKLSSIQNNDKRKYQACLERGIELCIIDTTTTKYFKPSTARQYLDIILSVIDIVNTRNGASGGILTHTKSR